jgi:hypothetical protein
MILICPKCQKQNRPGARFCGYCGTVFPVITNSPTSVKPAEFSNSNTPLKTYWLALVLCVFASMILGMRLQAARIVPSVPRNSSSSNTNLTPIIPTTVPTSNKSGYSDSGQTQPDSVPSYTPVLQTDTPASPTEIALVNPTDFIYTYYGYLNSHDYISAWSCLSDGFISKMGDKVGHPYTYTNDYVAYWDTVAKMDILETNTDSMDSQSAVVLLRLRWNMLSGAAPIYNHRFYLVKNPVGNSWLIDVTETWK